MSLVLKILQGILVDENKKFLLVGLHMPAHGQLNCHQQQSKKLTKTVEIRKKGFD